MIRTRNFQTKNEIFETAVLVKRLEKERMSALTGNKEIAFSGKQQGQCTKENACSFLHDESARGKVTQSSSLAPRPQTQNDEKKFFEREISQRPQSFWTQMSKYVQPMTLMETVRIRHVIGGILPCVKITKTESGCKFGEECMLGTKRCLTVSLTKSTRKVVGKVLLLSCRIPSNRAVCFKPQKFKSILRKGSTFFGQKRSVLKKYIVPRKNFGKETVHRKVIFSILNLMSVAPMPRKFEDKTEEETLKQERCARSDAWKMAISILKLEEKDKSYIFLDFGGSVSTSAILNQTRGKNICGGFWSLDAHAEQERSEFSCTGDSSIIQKPYNGHHSKRRSANERGSNSVRLRSLFIRDNTNPRGHASSPIAWKTLRRSRIFI